MFYDKFQELCRRRGVSCTRASLEMGLSNATPTKWKKTGATPNGETLQRVADYFHVPVSSLLAESVEEVVGENEELIQYLQMLKTRPECRMLFQVSRYASKEDVETAVRIIEAIRNK